MSNREKMIKRLLSRPKDYKFEEADTLIRSFEYRLSNKGKTSGSRVMYINEQGGKLFMHKPHPDSTLKSYQIDDLIDALKKEGLL
jgi:hypothetical protein